MSFISRLDYYLSEKGKFNSFILHVIGYPMLLVAVSMGLCFDIMGLTDHVSAPGLRVIGLLFIVLAMVLLFAFKGVKPRPSVGIVAMLTIYLVAILMCSIPYVYYGFPLRLALFESVSGITTTGMSVLHLSEMNGPLLMWRAITGWIGGLIFVMLFCLYFSEFGLAGRYTFSPGSTSVDSDVYKMQVGKIAVRYIIIYFASTVVLSILLIITGTETVASVRIAMSTVSTTGFMDMHGGLVTLSPASRAIIGLFMFVTMFNFMATFSAVVKKSLRPFKEDNESLYLIVWLIIIGLVALVLLFNHDIEPGNAEGYLDFVLVLLSTASTTGFVISDYSWPAGLVLVFCLGAVVGGSTESPTGGVKVARAAMSLKIMKNEVHEVSFPNLVNTLRIRQVNVTEDVAYAALLTMVMFFITLIAGTILISLTELDMETALYVATSAITTTGKGLYSIGDVGDINSFAQTVCMVLMIIGRLEVILIVVLLSPEFWRDLFSRVNLRKIISGMRQGF